MNDHLIQRAQKGDEAALNAIFDQYHAGIFRYLYYRVGDAQAAEDLTSEVFERMLRHLRSFKSNSDSFPSWLFRIAHNLAADYHRKNNKRARIPISENLTDLGELPEQSLERRLTSQVLARALSQLNEEQREVVLLRFVIQLPIADVARALEKSEDAIKGLQRRGLSAMRDILTNMEVDYGSQG